MTAWTLIRRSLGHYWRTQLGVLAGAAVATAVLVGGLAIGDSVRYSLRRLALARLGEVRLALAAGDRYVRADPAGRGDLAADLASDLGAPVGPALHLAGSATGPDGQTHLAGLQVYGIGERFTRAVGDAALLPGEGGVVLNRQAAARLGAEPGDEVLLRVEKPSALPRDAPLGRESDATVTLRLAVVAVAPDDGAGRFGLQANQLPPSNAFVRLGELQDAVELAGGANLLVVGPAEGGADVTVEAAEAALAKRWRLADAGLALRALEGGGGELTSRRIFIAPTVSRAAAKVDPGAVGVLTYFVNAIETGEGPDVKATPYSMVAAIGPLAGARLAAPWDAVGGLGDEGMVLTQWLADDLGAGAGHTVRLAYYVLKPGGGLETRTRAFTVRGTILMDHPAADRTLMPPFPGLAKQEDCSDWDVGIPVALDTIRDKDEAYWDAYRGTPKAFVSLAAGRAMWGNRFGDLTAVRLPGGGGADGTVALAAALRGQLDPTGLGLFFLPVRQTALDASAEALDFGELFLGLSMFLLGSALLLVALLFVFGVEQRTEEIGTLLALGLTPRRVRWLILGEGAALALVGGAVGTGLGLVYTWLTLGALTGVWSGAVAGTTLFFHATPGSVAIGAASGFVAAVAAMWVALRRRARRPARELLAGSEALDLAAPLAGRRRGWIALALGAALVLAAGAMVAVLGRRALEAGGGGAGAFFGAGAMLLAGGLVLGYGILALMAAARGRAGLTFGGLSARNATRRRGRSLATLALLACGTFMVVAVTANRKSPLDDAGRRASGTGGFALVAETATPVYRDLDDPGVRADYGMRALDRAVRIVPLRVRAGDEASCLNLNRPQQPRLFGVDPGALAERGAFRFAHAPETVPEGGPWALLDARGGPDEPVPAIVDHGTLLWSLGLKPGDTLTYTAADGSTFDVRFVATLAASILQGGIVIDEDVFLAKYPGVGGHRMFLIDAPEGGAGAAADVLRRGLRSRGVRVTPARARLAEYFQVENTYLSIFQLLGGLGLAIGSLGLGLVVLRNVLERRGELALMRAVGFERARLRRLVLLEHWALLAAGLVWGTLTAAVAVIPAVLGMGQRVPYGSVAVLVAAIGLSGLVWISLAARAALRGALLEGLRSE